MDQRIILVIALVSMILMINGFVMLTRAKQRSSSGGKGRKRPAQGEEKRAEWRDKEIARRIRREEDDAYERVKLRNETLQYYETVRQRHAHEDGPVLTGDDLEEHIAKQVKSMTLTDTEHINIIGGDYQSLGAISKEQEV